MRYEATERVTRPMALMGIRWGMQGNRRTRTHVDVPIRPGGWVEVADDVDLAAWVRDGYLRPGRATAVPGTPPAAGANARVALVSAVPTQPTVVPVPAPMAAMDVRPLEQVPVVTRPARPVGVISAPVAIPLPIPVPPAAPVTERQLVEIMAAPATLMEAPAAEITAETEPEASADPVVEEAHQTGTKDAAKRSRVPRAKKKPVAR